MLAKTLMSRTLVVAGIRAKAGMDFTQILFRFGVGNPLINPAFKH